MSTVVKLWRDLLDHLALNREFQEHVLKVSVLLFQEGNNDHGYGELEGI